MKILQINSVCGQGSTGRIATDLYYILEQEGHECKIAYGRGEVPKNIKTIKIGTDLDIYKHVIKTRIFDKHGFASVKATKEFIEKVKEYNPDVIHLHNIHGYYINIKVLFQYLKESKKPVIWTLHDCWTFTGHCCHFDYVKCNKWKSVCSKCPQKNRYPSSLLCDNCTNNFKEKKRLVTSLDNLIIVTPSKWLANLVEESFLAKYPIKVINNGIDLDIFKPTNSAFREKNNVMDKKLILGVANIWNKSKGLQYFLELSKKLDDNYQIILVGITEKQKKTLSSNIIGITRTNNVKELVEIYNSVDLFVNPTLEEVMGLVNIEALACGTPVITFNTGGSIECIDDSCGQIVEKGNIEKLHEAIESVISNPKEVYSEKCIERARKYYDKNNKYMEYLNLYEVKK